MPNSFLTCDSLSFISDLLPNSICVSIVFWRTRCICGRFRYPTISRRAMLLHITTFPLMPFQCNLRTYTLHKYRTTSTSTQRACFSGKRQVLKADTYLSLSIQPTSNRADPCRIIFLRTHRTIYLTIYPKFGLLSILSRFNGTTNFMYLTCPLTVLHPPKDRTNLSSARNRASVIHNRISFNLYNDHRTITFIIISRRIRINVPFLTVPFRPTRRLFTRMMFLIHFFLCSIPRRCLPILELQGINIRFARRPSLFYPCIHPVSTNAVLYQRRNKISVRPRCPSDLTRCAFPFLTRFRVFW